MKRRLLSAEIRQKAVKIGMKIRELRENAKLSQGKLAEQLSVPQSTISNWETGLYLPDIIETFHLVNFFGVDINVFKEDLENKIVPSTENLSIVSLNDKLCILEQKINKKFEQLEKKINASKS